MIARGWSQVDADPSAAAATFRRVLDLAPNDIEGNYGYGYALLMAGRVDDAVEPLCKARNTTDADILQDVNGLLAARRLSCR